MRVGVRKRVGEVPESLSTAPSPHVVKHDVRPVPMCTSRAQWASAHSTSYHGGSSQKMVDQNLMFLRVLCTFYLLVMNLQILENRKQSLPSV